MHVSSPKPLDYRYVVSFTRHRRFKHPFADSIGPFKLHTVHTTVRMHACSLKRPLARCHTCMARALGSRRQALVGMQRLQRTCVACMQRRGRGRRATRASVSLRAHMCIDAAVHACPHAWRLSTSPQSHARTLNPTAAASRRASPKRETAVARAESAPLPGARDSSASCAPASHERGRRRPCSHRRGPSRGPSLP